LNDMDDKARDDPFSIAKVQLHSNLRALNPRSFYRIDRFDGRRWHFTFDESFTRTMPPWQN